MVCHHLGGEGVPDMLVTRVHSDGRSDGEIVKHLYAFFVLDGRPARQPLNVFLQIAADSVVVKPNAVTVIRSAAQQTAAKHRDTRIATQRIRAARRITQPPEDSDSPKLLAAHQHFRNLRGRLFYYKILRETRYRKFGVSPEIDRQVSTGRLTQQRADGRWHLRRRQSAERSVKVNLRLVGPIERWSELARPAPCLVR